MCKYKTIPLTKVIMKINFDSPSYNLEINHAHPGVQQKIWRKYWIFSWVMKLMSPPRTISLPLPLVGFGVHAQLLPAKPASVPTPVRDNRATLTSKTPHATSAFHIKGMKFEPSKTKGCFNFHLKNLISFFGRLFLCAAITSLHLL